MATFDYGAACAFNQAGNSANFSQNVTQASVTGTLSDDNGDGTFTLAETVTDPNILTIFPDYVGPPTDPAPTVVGSYDTGSDVWLVVLYPNSSPNATGQSGTDNLVFYGPPGADKSLLPGTNENITIAGDITQTDVPQCFAAGTLIATPSGETRVENLAINDPVHTADGRSVVVKWIGRHTITHVVNGAKLSPVRIQAGALGGGLPYTDLVVTADHGMIIDGLVINASALVNGTTIDFLSLAELPDRVTYYHIETEEHDIILANGAESETFVDYVGRKTFDNYLEYLELFGAERVIREMFRPRISSRRLVPETIKLRLDMAGDDINDQHAKDRVRAEYVA